MLLHMFFLKNRRTWMADMNSGAYGIGTPLEDKAEGPVYDLQGRRVSNPKKGIYIKDGRKVLVK